MSIDPSTLALSPDKIIFRGNNTQHDAIQKLDDPPPWRRFSAASRKERGSKHRASAREIIAVNTALYLRRPLLITGKPGTGKTSLAYAVQHELKLDDVLVWSITSRSQLQHGLYHYDAIARLQDASLAKNTPEHDKNSDTEKAAAASRDIGRYLRLGPLGAALYLSRPNRPSVLLIDEIDKSDIDLPNDLLHIFEEGEFEIPELARLPDGPAHDQVEVELPKGGKAVIQRGKVRCQEFPLVFMTSNGERAFPPAFLRRCLRLDIDWPTDEVLGDIVRERLEVDRHTNPAIDKLIKDFVIARDKGQQLATDQLLNAVQLVTQGLMGADHDSLKKDVLRDLTDTPA